MSEQQVSTATRWAIRIPAFIALGASAVMLRASLEPGGGVPGCGGATFDCASVLATRWAYWMTLPVSALGVLLHALVVAASVQLHPDRPAERRRLAWRALVALAVIAAAGACWFLGIQFAMRSSLCLYCITAHLAGLALCVIVIAKAPLVPLSSVGAGVLAVAVVVGGQLLGPTPSGMVFRARGGFQNIDTGPGPRRIVTILATPEVPGIGLNPHHFPMIGSPDAQRILVYLFDYTCVHCRALHRMLEEVQPRFGDQLGIVLLPIPLNSDCNPSVPKTEPAHEHACDYARLALAVFELDRSKFNEFDRYLSEGETWPSVEDARRKAESLVDPDELERVLNDPELDGQLEFYAHVLERTEVPRLPQMIYGGLTISGRPASAETLAQDLARELNMTLPSP